MTLPYQPNIPQSTELSWKPDDSKSKQLNYHDIRILLRLNADENWRLYSKDNILNKGKAE